MKTLSLWLFFMICLMILLPINGSQKNPKEPLPSEEFTQLSEQELQAFKQFNEIANKYFKGCSVNDTVFILLTKCSIPTKNYGNFLYEVHQKEYTLYFIDLYRQQNRMDEIYKSDTDEFLKKIKVLLTAAFSEWVEIFKPKSEVTIEQAYEDIHHLDRKILDVVEHNSKKYKDLIDILKTFRQMSPQSFLIAEDLENKNQVSDHLIKTWAKYVKDPEEWASTPISRKQFIYFVREIAIYLYAPTLPTLKGKKTLPISQDQLFQITSMVKKQVEKLKHLIGDSFIFSQAAKYAQIIIVKVATNLSGANDVSTGQTEQSKKMDPQNEQKGQRAEAESVERTEL